MGVQTHADCASVGWIGLYKLKALRRTSKGLRIFGAASAPHVWRSFPDSGSAWTARFSGAMLIVMPNLICRACLPVIVWLSLAGNLCGLPQPSEVKLSPAVVKVHANRCVRLTPEQREWLGPEWERFLPFVRSCEVTWQKSPPLYVLTVWADQFEATLPKDAPAEKLPKPMIAAKDGKVLGRLPVGFPLDPPRTSDISFTNWSGGFPHRVRIAVADPTVLGDHTLVLDWDAQDHAFVSKKSKK